MISYLPTKDIMHGTTRIVVTSLLNYMSSWYHVVMRYELTES